MQGNNHKNELHLFAGAGGGILGGISLGHRPVCAVEINPYCRRVLLQRQRDGILPWFPVWDDVRTFDGRPWNGIADIVSGGFPCQDISRGGLGAGIEGERSGLWVEMARIIREVGPRYVFVENSAMLTSRGLGRVLGDLASMGYDAQWGVIGAIHAGAPHHRERIWILADADVSGAERRQRPPGDAGRGITRRRNAWENESPVPGVADGVADRLDRFAAIGNGQVPAVVRLAWSILPLNDELRRDGSTLPKP